MINKIFKTIKKSSNWHQISLKLVLSVFHLKYFHNLNIFEGYKVALTLSCLKVNELFDGIFHWFKMM